MSKRVSFAGAVLLGAAVTQLTGGCGGGETGGSPPAPQVAVDAAAQDAAPAPQSDASFAPRDSGGTPNPPIDAATNDDAGGATGVACPTQPCGAGTVCCVVNGMSVQCLTQCPNGEQPVECAGPADCTPSVPICCGTATLTGGTIPNCTAGAASASCVSTCAENLPLSCTGIVTSRLCTASADCKGDPNGNTVCCTFPQARTPICTSTFLSTFATSCN